MPSWCLWRRLSLEEVHLHSCLFVSICGSSSLTISRFSSNDPPTRAGLALLESPVVFTILWNGPNPPDRTEMSSEPRIDTNCSRISSARNLNGRGCFYDIIRVHWCEFVVPFPRPWATFRRPGLPCPAVGRHSREKSLIVDLGFEAKPVVKTPQSKIKNQQFIACRSEASAG